MTWDDLSNGAAAGMVASFWGMVIMWAVCLVLSWYLGNVLPGGGGGGKSLLFFLPKSLRPGGRKSTGAQIERDIKAAMAKESEDVAVERIRTERHARHDGVESLLVRQTVPRGIQALADRDDASHKHGEVPAVRAYNLRKVFTNPDGKEFVANNGTSMSLFHGQCLGLVGPNGAGKTTFISMLSGQHKPDGGDAFLGDASVTQDIERIYRRMGVCPQSDVLWPDLTAAETLRFYATLKGLTGAQRQTHVDYWLEQVDLVAAKDRVTSTYSGGMRRRLCVACSMIGGPATVFLDEPSASLDPASRHRLWDVIKANKATTTMLLTTHSMAEASELCDRVGIFVEGKLRAIGSPDYLQSRYGSKLKVALTTNPDRKSVLRGEAILRQLSSDAKLVSSLAGTSNFELDRERSRLSVLFRELGRAVAAGDILDFGIANTTLEEVFIDILFVNKDDGEAARKDDKKEAADADADDFAYHDDRDVRMTNIVSNTLARSSKRTSQIIDVIDLGDDDDDEDGGGKSEVGEAELDVLRAQLARSKSLKQLSRMNTAHDGIAERAARHDSGPSLIVSDQRSLSRAPSRHATIKIDDIALDISVDDGDDLYPFQVEGDQEESMRQSARRSNIPAPITPSIRGYDIEMIDDDQNDDMY
jgi:ABC-type multidrug transport system ATPase subunit